MPLLLHARMEAPVEWQCIMTRLHAANLVLAGLSTARVAVTALLVCVHAVAPRPASAHIQMAADGDDCQPLEYAIFLKSGEIGCSPQTAASGMVQVRWHFLDV